MKVHKGDTRQLAEGQEEGGEDENPESEPSTVASSSKDNSSNSESDVRGSGQERGSGVGKRGGRTLGRGTRGRRGRGKPSEKVTQIRSEPSTCTNSSENETDVVYPVCESKYSENTEWVQCDNLSCSKWYHVSCTGIDPQDYHTLASATWLCPDCEM